MTIKTFIRNGSIMALVASLAVVLLSLISFRMSAAETNRPLESGEHVITLHDDGSQQGFYTKAKTLRAALEQAKVRLDPNDRTEPSLDQELVASSYEVNIYRAGPVIVRDSGAETKVISAYRTGEQIAKHAGIALNDEDISTLAPSKDVVVEGAAEVLTIDRALPFTFVFYGQTSQSYTQAKTVGEMLDQKKITLGKNDTVEPSKDTPMSANMTVKLWRNGKQTMTQEEDVDFEIEKVKDADREVGFREVKTPGEKGKKTVTYEIIMENGVEVSRKSINEIVTKQPVKQVETVGSKSAFSGDLAGAFAALRQCESGGNYANKRNPMYRGAYQFGYGTWANYGGYYDPADAPPEVQDQAALELYQRRGWQPWPACTSKLGLR